MLLGFGSLSVLMGGGAIASTAGITRVLAKKEKRKEQLRMNGTPIKARFKGVEKNTSTKFNGRSPYQLVAQWQDPTTSELYVFRSENIWFDPTEFVNVEDLTVLIEDGNPKNYYIDIDFLPKLAN